MVKTIKIKCQNGISFEEATRDILFDLNSSFNFLECDEPDFILFGPYGNNIPKKGNYIRIGYFCENIKPDLSICEYAFGIPREEEINNIKYKRIQWHGLNPNTLIKNISENDIDFIINQKTKFCNFIYSNPVPYREEFYKQLSKYKKIDSPGKSMNNMKSIDLFYDGNIWERKRHFLSKYKFTIAFENYVYPGYQTEKLYDAMQAQSIPIYFGDSLINEIFNSNSFINALEYTKPRKDSLISFLQHFSQQDFKDYRPTFYNQPHQKIIRRIKKIGRELKMSVQFNKLDFSPIIDKIIEIDNDPELYAQYLRQPWFVDNITPENSSLKNRWIEIFSPSAIIE
jgi:hypothetical protein